MAKRWAKQISSIVEYEQCPTFVTNPYIYIYIYAWDLLEIGTPRECSLISLKTRHSQRMSYGSSYVTAS